MGTSTNFSSEASNLMIALLLHATLAAENGEARLPPMGWRSWNTFYADINDQKIRAQVDALVKERNGTSLRSLGYASIGIDEGWEGCKLGVNGTVHYLNGTPAVDPKRFPSMPGLVKYGHSKGAKMGFYLNGCGCNEKRPLHINYEGDVRASIDWGFDGVKIDSCGAQKNMSLYYELFNESSRSMAIENCHQGQNITDGGDPGQMGPGWCPYNTFRTSGDIVNLWDRVMSNLMTVVPFLSPDTKHGGAPTNVTHPMSRPGCWAYPDMLEVGRMPEHNAAESRSHFSAWAIVSAPLVLGFDLSDDTKLDAAWPVISNKEVIAVSQTWVKGVPYPSGRLLKSWQAKNAPTITVRGGCGKIGCVDSNVNCSMWAKEMQCELNPAYMHSNCRKSCHTCEAGNYSEWSYADGQLKSTGEMCLDLDGQLPAGHGGSNVLHTMPCDGSKPSQQWLFNKTNGAIHHKSKTEDGDVCLRAFSTWLWDRPVVDTQGCDPAKPGVNELWSLNANGTLNNGVAHVNGQFGCIEVSGKAGPPSTIWAKPLDKNGKMALLAINGADLPQKITLNYTELLGPAHGKLYKTRDVWEGKWMAGTPRIITKEIGPHDCLMVVVTPLSE